MQQAVADLVVGLRRIRQPVIAVVAGIAAGGGLSLACAADIRIAEPAATFIASFVRLGVSGGDLGSSYFLPRIVGWDRPPNCCTRAAPSKPTRRCGSGSLPSWSRPARAWPRRGRWPPRCSRSRRFRPG
jgi:hypothetical protein